MRIIAGEARGRTIQAPPGNRTRPTLDRVRENLFNMIQGEVSGSRVLDLFAGSGALSLEALSRGAAYAVMVDRDRNAHRCQQANLQALGMAEKAKTMLSEWQSAMKALGTAGERFDLIFLDPPYEMSDLREVFEGLGPLMARECLIVSEHPAGKPPAVPPEYAKERERDWGYCGVTLYRRKEEAPEEMI